MHPLVRFILRCAAVFAVLYLFVQPYNWFCNLTGNCRSFHLSDLFPKKEVGDFFDVVFEVKNYNEDIVFEPDASSVKTLFNRKMQMTFYVKNLSSKTVTFKPQLTVEPISFKNYVETYDCPCSRQYTLKSGENIKINMEFSIDSDLMKNSDYIQRKSQPNGTVIKLRYEIKTAKN